MSYSMNYGLEVTNVATADITNWLKNRPETIEVVNVENDPSFQKRDIDLIWKTQNQKVLIEIKGDCYHKTGNFFFETDSNLERQTPGCFMYTEADWIFYYFVGNKTLYQLPMPLTKEWFIKNINRFRKRSTQTLISGGGYYTTVGRLVPINDVIKEVTGVIQINLDTD
jgi:hypothetical protein